MNASPFILFGNIHIITMLVILAVSILLPMIYKNKSEVQKSLMTKMIAYIVIAHVVISPYKDLDLSEIFLAWFLLGGPKILYKCAFFWGIGGATMAIITPIGIMYATVALNNRPYAKDILTVSLITACVLLPITYTINLLLGEPANFWYLMAKPAGASLMDAFPEPPYHLLVLTPLAIATFVIIYVPYFIKDRLQK